MSDHNLGTIDRATIKNVLRFVKKNLRLEG